METINKEEWVKFLDPIKCAYLVKFVDPNKEYPVTYTIRQDGTKVQYSPKVMIKGEDLTQKQIVELFTNQLL